MFSKYTFGARSYGHNKPGHREVRPMKLKQWERFCGR